ncbi:hypothetical protein NPIL_208351 [Nephila pilipes]|uniref:Uncharacterized protein n=1 Tax=Nephila pilipes TaxID=299642 RepID=A0A8X6NLD5_NEPPI|nr:hypothetical protein NPIL_208351 [Nephila pilipes]
MIYGEALCRFVPSHPFRTRMHSFLLSATSILKELVTISPRREREQLFFQVILSIPPFVVVSRDFRFRSHLLLSVRVVPLSSGPKHGRRRADVHWQVSENI